MSIEVSHPLRIAIDGIDASGKSFLADELARILMEHGRAVIRGSSDGFHRPRSIRYRQGRHSPRGYFEDSFDYESIVSHLLEPLGPKGGRRYRIHTFDYLSDKPMATPLRRAGIEEILLFDGVFLMRAEIRDYWDFAIFVEVPFETALERAINRNATLHGADEDLRQLYLRRYYPGQRHYFEECHPRKHANVILFNEPFHRPKLLLNQYDLS